MMLRLRVVQLDIKQYNNTRLTIVDAGGQEYFNGLLAGELLRGRVRRTGWPCP
jgi:hypothetical protein